MRTVPGIAGVVDGVVGSVATSEDGDNGDDGNDTGGAAADCVVPGPSAGSDPRGAVERATKFDDDPLRPPPSTPIPTTHVTSATANTSTTRRPPITPVSLTARSAASGDPRSVRR